MSDPALGIILFFLGVTGGAFSAMCFMSIRDGERHIQTLKGTPPNPVPPCPPRKA